MYTVCLVEDEIDLSNLIRTYLQKAGYEVVTFTKGVDALNYIGKEVHIWILDIMLADDINGYDIIKEIRKHDEDVPVIFTSARDQELDKILGLELGSDDYLTKPYSSKELVLRVNKIIKRVYKDDISNVIDFEGYNIDFSKRVVKDNEEEIKLTTLEFDLLTLFLKNIGKSFSRDEILNAVWGRDYFGSDRVVDDLVRRVRKRLPKLKLSAIYGYGYRLLWSMLGTV